MIVLSGRDLAMFVGSLVFASMAIGYALHEVLAYLWSWRERRRAADVEPEWTEGDEAWLDQWRIGQ